MQDEFERFQSDKAFKYLGLFLAISLAIWSLYNLIVYGSAGMPFVLFVLGQWVYFLVNYWPKWKYRNQKERGSCMSKQDVIRFIGSLFLAELILNASLIMLSISWRTIFISNVALVILYGIAEYREQKRLKEEGIPSIDERVVNKMKSYFTISMTSFVFLFIMYLCVNKYLDRPVVHVNELLYIAIFGLLISMASTSVLATRNR